MVTLIQQMQLVDLCQQACGDYPFAAESYQLPYSYPT